MITTRACDGKFDISGSFFFTIFYEEPGAIKRTAGALLIEEFD
jgi:hypothetical protein